VPLLEDLHVASSTWRCGPKPNLPRAHVVYGNLPRAHVALRNVGRLLWIG